jgi:hypothetical protein
MASKSGGDTPLCRLARRRARASCIYNFIGILSSGSLPVIRQGIWNGSFPRIPGLTRWLRECLLRGCSQAVQQARRKRPPTCRAFVAALTQDSVFDWREVGARSQPRDRSAPCTDSARDETASAFIIGRRDTADTSSDEHRWHNQVSVVSTLSRLRGTCVDQNSDP